MNKSIITILIIMLISTSSLGIVSAENITNAIASNESESELKVKTATSEDESRIGETVKSNEKGHYNITFSDGYSGYCINYGKNEAEIGDDFRVQETSKAVNNNNGESIGNYLKIFFTEFHDLAMEDKVKTQHYLWALSDDFKGWRVNQGIIQEIKEIAKTKTVPDNGASVNINNTTKATYYFEMLETATSANQNFFAYRIDYESIIKDIINDTGNNNLLKSPEEDENESQKTNPENNTAAEIPDKNETITEESSITEQNNNTTTSITPQTDENITEPVENYSMISEESSISHDVEKMKLSKYSTGNPWLVTVVIIILAVIAILHFKRD